MDDSGKPESLFRRFLWKNSGLLCLVTLLTLPIILGVAVGYVIVLAVLTIYKKIRGEKSRHEKEHEAKQKIRIVLGHNLLESSLTKPLEVHAHQNRAVCSSPVHYGSMSARNLRLSDEIESDEDPSEEEMTKPETREEEVANYNDVNKQDADKNDSGLATSSCSAADHNDGSRAASASSEYYSTTSELDELVPIPCPESAVPNPPDVQDTNTKVDTKVSEPDVINRGVVDEVCATVTQGTEEVKAFSESPPCSLGKLKYNIEYREDSNQLHVSILRVINLPVPAGDPSPGTSSYVKVSLLPQRFCWQRTKVVEGIHPIFNETFVISGFSHEKIGAYTLLVCVVNAAMSQWQGYHGDHVIGEVYVPLSHVIKCATNEGKATCGWRELRPKLAQFQGLTKCGKINLSLCYRPISGRLIVTIKKARDLKCDNKEKFDPFVKLAVYCDGTRVGRGATRVKHKVLSPIFNEKFNFDLTSDQITYTTVVVKLLNNMEGVYLGATVLGYESPGNGQEHWICMMECLSQHVDAWHSLYN